MANAAQRRNAPQNPQNPQQPAQYAETTGKPDKPTQLPVLSDAGESPSPPSFS
jgi:hypothetical protein